VSSLNITDCFLTNACDVQNVYFDNINKCFNNPFKIITMNFPTTTTTSATSTTTTTKATTTTSTTRATTTTKNTTTLSTTTTTKTITTSSTTITITTTIARSYSSLYDAFKNYTLRSQITLFNSSKAFAGLVGYGKNLTNGTARYYALEWPGSIYMFDSNWNSFNYVSFNHLVYHQNQSNYLLNNKINF
jgi:hypothetical protein